MRWVILMAFACGSEKPPAPTIADSCVLDAKASVTAHEITAGTVETMDSSTPPPPVKTGDVYGGLVGDEAGQRAPMLVLKCTGTELDVVMMVRGTAAPHRYTFPSAEGSVSGLGKHKWLGRHGSVEIATVKNHRIAGTIDVTGELLGGGTIVMSGTFDLPLRAANTP